MHLLQRVAYHGLPTSCTALWHGATAQVVRRICTSSPVGVAVREKRQALRLWPSSHVVLR